MNIKIIMASIVLLIVAICSGCPSNKPLRPLTRVEAQAECERCLYRVAKRDGLDPTRFELLGWRQYVLAPRNTPTWEFFYRTPQDPEIVYEVVWMEELRKAERWTVRADDWEGSIDGLVKPRRGDKPKNSAIRNRE